MPFDRFLYFIIWITMRFWERATKVFPSLRLVVDKTFEISLPYYLNSLLVEAEKYKTRRIHVFSKDISAIVNSKNYPGIWTRLVNSLSSADICLTSCAFRLKWTTKQNWLYAMNKKQLLHHEIIAVYLFSHLCRAAIKL